MKMTYSVMTCYLLCVITMLAISLVDTSQFSRNEQQEIVEKHNFLRTQVKPSAGNMEKMIWDDLLADMAQNWSDRCLFEHGRSWDKEDLPFPYLGQNIWMGTKSQNKKLTSLIVQDWWDEINYYTYSNHSCEADKICGHYLQVSTAESVRVGCGWTDCTSRDLRALIVVCDYQRPRADPSFPRPYKSGESCSSCKSNSGWCEDGLCAECLSPIHESHKKNINEDKKQCDLQKLECKTICYNCGRLNSTTCKCSCAPGWGSINCATKCKDENDACSRILPPNQRTTTACPSDIHEHCRKTCGLCDGIYNDTKNLCCGGVLCDNGGVLDLTSCSCVCPKGTYGKYCESLSNGSAPSTDNLNKVLFSSLFIVFFICNFYSDQ